MRLRQPGLSALSLLWHLWEGSVIVLRQVNVLQHKFRKDVTHDACNGRVMHAEEQSHATAFHICHSDILLYMLYMLKL